MSWSGWGTKLNVTSFVSQGLEQVRSLREDVEKQFDQVVTGAPGSHSVSAVSTSTSATSTASTASAAPVDDVAAKPTASVDDIGVIKSTVWESDAEAADQTTKRTIQPPPHSTGGNQRGADFPPLVRAQVPLVASPAPPSLFDEPVVNTEREDRPLAVNSSYPAQYGDGGEDEEKMQETTGEDSAIAVVTAVDTATVEKDEQCVGETPEDEVPALPVACEAPPSQEETDVNDVEELEISEPISQVQELVEEPSGQSEPPVDLVEAAPVQEDKELDDETPECRAEDVPKDSEEVATLRRQLEVREAQLLATSSTIQELHDELDKTCHREVAAVERAQFLTEQLEQMRREVSKLNQLHRESSSQSSELEALQVALSEKDDQLRGLLDEGQALSVKQAQYEQRLRSLRKEKDELEERALKAQSLYDAETVETQELSAKLKASEDDKTRLAQENRKLASCAEATAAKVDKAERETREAAQRLGELQTQVDELKLETQRKGKEVEGLKTASQSNETLSQEKAELQQMLQFLQDNVRDLEQEAAHREDMARSEISSLKRKWQDALARVDMLGQGVSEATQPLLRQIHALQEDQRARQETWKATERALLQRIADADALRKEAEQDKVDVEQQIHDLRSQSESLELEVSRKQAELERAKKTTESVEAKTHELRGQVDALLADLEQAKRQRDMEVAAKEQLQLRIHNVERASKKSEATTAASAELEETRKRETQLLHDLEWHQKELQKLRTASQSSAQALRSTGSSSSTLQRFVAHNLDSAASSTDEDLSSQASILKTTMETTESLGGSDANTSVLGLSQLQQRVRLREGENRMLKQQLEALEARQKQTTDEIVRLSTRNALLESDETQRAQAQEELAQLHKHQHVLLELFGEKEEQVEELQAEVGELKAFYRKQLDTLATQKEQQLKQQQ